MNQTRSNDSSLNMADYVNQTAQLIALPIDPAYQEGTIANFERIYSITLPLLEFSLPDTVEVAPVFRPDL